MNDDLKISSGNSLGSPDQPAFIEPFPLKKQMDVSKQMTHPGVSRLVLFKYTRFSKRETQPLTSSDRGKK